MFEAESRFEVADGILPAAVSGVDDALLILGQRMVAQAAANAPVKFGVLRASIMAATFKDQEIRSGFTADTVVPTLGEKAGEMELLVGSNVEYAAAQEYGTTRFPAQPYLGPAFESIRGGGEAVMAKTVKEAVEDAAKRKREADAASPGRI